MFLWLYAFECLRNCAQKQETPAVNWLSLRAIAVSCKMNSLGRVESCLPLNKESVGLFCNASQWAQDYTISVCADISPFPWVASRTEMWLKEVQVYPEKKQWELSGRRCLLSNNFILEPRQAGISIVESTRHWNNKCPQTSILQTFIENLRKGVLLDGILNTKGNQEAPVVYRPVEAGGNCKARQEKVKTLRGRHRFGAEKENDLLRRDPEWRCRCCSHICECVHFCWGDWKWQAVFSVVS